MMSETTASGLVDDANRIILADPVFQTSGNNVLCARSWPSTRRFIRTPAQVAQGSYPANLGSLRFHTAGVRSRHHFSRRGARPIGAAADRTPTDAHVRDYFDPELSFSLVRTSSMLKAAAFCRCG
jgi:hypothetical protein